MTITRQWGRYAVSQRGWKVAESGQAFGTSSRRDGRDYCPACAPLHSPR